VHVSPYGEEPEARLNELEQRVRIKLVRLLSKAPHSGGIPFPPDLHSTSIHELTKLANLVSLEVPALLLLSLFTLINNMSTAESEASPIEKAHMESQLAPPGQGSFGMGEGLEEQLSPGCLA
jgi:hypothetical protein